MMGGFGEGTRQKDEISPGVFKEYITWLHVVQNNGNTTNTAHILVMLKR
jgi:hypothetical protein